MTARSPRFEICRGEDGYWARFRAANGRIVWVTENYARRRGAERAILSLADSMWSASRPVILPDQHDGMGSYVWEEAEGHRIEVREVDERRPPSPEPAIQQPVWHTRDIRGRDYWHDGEIHYRNCYGDGCSQTEPPKGVEVQCRFGRVKVK